MTGHRPSYLRRIVDILVADYHVIVAMPSHCFDHQVVKDVFSQHDSSRLTGIRCDTTNQDTKQTNPFHLLLAEYQCVRFYRAALKKAQLQAQIDLIFIESLDDVVILSGITGLTFGTIPWLGIVIRQHFHLAQMGAIGPPESKQAVFKKRLFIRLLERARENSLVMTIDRLLLDYVKSNHPDISHAFAHIPDAVDDRVPITNPNIREELGIPATAFVVMAYGSLRDSKGVKLLADAMHKLPDNIHVMLIGKQHLDVKTYLEREQQQKLFAAGRLHQLDRYIDVTEDANFFTAADLIWVGYKNYYSMSAVLVQAAQYRRPVLAANTGLVGWLTNQYQTGIVIDTSKQQDIVTSIMDASTTAFVADESQYNALVEAHSLKAFEGALMTPIKKLIA